MNETAPFGPGCPWHDSLTQFGPPNLKWCEQTVCAWINEPANTWSNVPFMLVGAWIAYTSWKNREKWVGFFGAAIFAMGAFSFLYHATNNYLTQVIDFLGMYLFLAFAVTANSIRAGLIKKSQFWLVYIAINTVFVAIIPLLRSAEIPYQFLVIVFGVSIFATELLARKADVARFGKTDALKPFILAGFAFLIAQCFSLIDLKRVYCDPDNHLIQGHAIWHVVCSLGCWLMYRYYRPILNRTLQ